MTHESPFVSLDEVAQVTGLTNRMIRNDVRKGFLPGEIDHRKRVVIRRTDWNQYLATGEWKSDQPVDTRKPVGIVSIRKDGVA